MGKKRKRFTVSNINKRKVIDGLIFSSGLGFSHRTDAEKYAKHQRKDFRRWARIEKTKTQYGDPMYLVWKKNKPKKGQKIKRMRRKS